MKAADDSRDRTRNRESRPCRAGQHAWHGACGGRVGALSDKLNARNLGLMGVSSMEIHRFGSLAAC